MTHQVFFSLSQRPLHTGGLVTPSAGESWNCRMGRRRRGKRSNRAMMVIGADRMITDSIDGSSQGGGGL